MRIAGCAAVLGALLAGAVAAHAQAGGWIGDTSVGCQIWNPHPQSNETIRWSGACANGFAQGRGVLILQGVRYKGEFRNGKPNGSGTLVNATGTFRGTWMDGCFRDGNRKASFGVPLSACP
jgi:hypothetical protein